MRTAITIGIHHGGEIVELLFGPSTSIDDQRSALKRAKSSRSHERFRRVEIWESDIGRTVHHDFHEVSPLVVSDPESIPAHPASPPAPDSEPSPSESDSDFEVGNQPKGRGKRR